MARTITLADDLVELAERSAETRGISVDELVRELLVVESFKLQSEQSGDISYENDPFLSDREFYTGPTPPDLIENHDDYLYGDQD
jgi:hypothetical protein